MDDSFESLGSPTGDGGGDGGGVSSDESTTAGSILVSNKNNQEMGTSAEVSSPFVVVGGGNLELGLGLSIGGGGGGCSGGDGGGYGGQYAGVLTAKGFPLSSVKNPNLSTGVSPSSVVGWPPIRRGHKLPNLNKSLEGQASSTPEPNRALKIDKYADTKEVVFEKGYQPVKVSMDGILIGRKVDLSAHNTYETLAQTIEDMFFEKQSSTEAAGPSMLLDATSEFVLTYEDKDGDCMLLGDVPWQMFLSSVKRLRIMRNPEYEEVVDRKPTAASPTCQEKKTAA